MSDRIQNSGDQAGSGAPAAGLIGVHGVPSPNHDPDRQLPLWMLYPLFFVAIFFSHATLLRLPYFWDEGGYYIPSAYDFFRTGTLIPVSTVTNAHPPMPSLLLAGWWHLSGFNVIGTRTLVCMVAAAALLAVYRLARQIAGDSVAAVVTLLTALYPVWFAQSTLAHADIFAAAFSLWAFSFYVEGQLWGEPGSAGFPPIKTRLRAEIGCWVLFALAALSKETAIVTPAALALWELIGLVRNRTDKAYRKARMGWFEVLAATVLPLIGWYAYHRRKTGFIFGNPEYLRYNATANLDAHRILLCLYHRALHLTGHMNLFAPVLCAMAAMLMPRIAGREARGLTKPVLSAIWAILLAHWVMFSILGGALLTRYLLPAYPLIVLLCCIAWFTRMKLWGAAAAFSAVAFIAGIFINPPYAFAPEDNLTYRDMIVLHQRAVAVIDAQFPDGRVLTAWPGNAELMRPELGYTKKPVKTASIDNFSATQILRAAEEPGEFDTALVFSTKWAPPSGGINLSEAHEATDAKYFDFHEDLTPEQIARLLRGDIVWQQRIRGEWAAVLRFPRSTDARLVLGR